MLLKPVEKPKRMGFGGFLGWRTHGDAGRVASLGRAWTLCTPSHTPCPMRLYHLLSRSHVLLQQTTDLVHNTSLSSLSSFSKLIEPKDWVVVTSDF